MINQTIIQGRLCADPELKKTQSDVSVCSFRIAWSKTYKENETKLFLNCTAWRGLGEFISKYFRKGQEIVVRGELSTHEWDTEGGDKRSQIILTVDEASFCGPKRDDASPSQTQTTSNAPLPGGPAQSYEQQSFRDIPSSFSGFSEITDDDDEIPF